MKVVTRFRSVGVGVAVGVTSIAQVGQVRNGTPAPFVITDALVAGAFVVGGVIAWRLGPTSWLGTVSVWGAVAWQMGTLAMLTRDHPVTFTFFAMSGYHDVAVGFLLLAYPAGRVHRRPGRWLLIALLGGHLFGTIARLIAFQPDAWGCDGCRHNPLAIVADEGAFTAIEDWTGRGLGLCVLAVATAVCLRWIGGSVPARRAAGLLPLAAAVWALLYVQDTWLRPLGRLVVDDPAAFYVLAAARGLVPISVAAGLTWMRLRQSRVADLLAGIGESPRRDEVESLLRNAIGDSELRVWWRGDEPDTYQRDGASGRAPLPASRLQVTSEMRRHDDVVAVVIHDASLLDDDRLPAAISATVRLVAERDRLTRLVKDQLEEVKQSRVRLLEAAAAERARLERDLHDGSQQRLVALAIRLRMASGLVESNESPELADALESARKELDEALAELRELARGIHPAALSDGGLPAALPLLADRSPVPTTVEIQLRTRLDPALESTLYFVAAEALTNVVRHADATRASVSLREVGDDVEISIRDDGIGGAHRGHGSGLRGLGDRVEAYGGSITIASDASRGTILVARVPK